MQARWIGAAARQILAQAQETRVLGTTSRGIFLSAEPDWVVFLTGDPFRGPLTLNLNEPPGSLRESVGDLVTVRADGLWLDQSRLWIATREAKTWSAPPCAETVLSNEVMRERLETVAGLIAAPQDAPLLPAAVREAEQAGEGLPLTQTLGWVSQNLGRGPGLTPAGDDLALGLLLALNRWPRLLPTGLPLDAIGYRLVTDARRKTTHLSASLIACAAQGQADERLISGLDGLVTGIPGAKQCAACFNGWGSSSGRSAFAGIQLGLTLITGRFLYPQK